MSSTAIRLGPHGLEGELQIPAGSTSGLVIFAHGSGSGRLSPRNQSVARALQAHGLGTLLFDLLTDEEARDRRNVFDIELLAGRLGDALDWQQGRADIAQLPIGLFGASTGAAAALVAAAEHADRVSAVVSRGGRPDLAGLFLLGVRAPTLMIVGGADREVLELNRLAAERLTCECEIRVVPGATHLFEEPGTLETVAALAAQWFTLHLKKAGEARRESPSTAVST
jgi:pimeloyl-ACP methyl ester carboxylesterase